MLAARPEEAGMGFMDKAKKLAEQAQQKLDEAQQNFNKSGSPQAGPQEGGVRYDEHGRPIQEAPLAGAAPPPSAEPPASEAPPAPDPEAPPAPDPGAPPAPETPPAPSGDQPNAAPDPFKRPEQ
jgi:hypothetical protein